MDAKALINFKEGTVELLGSEEFISQYLDKFKDSLTNISKGTSSARANEVAIEVSNTPEPPQRAKLIQTIVPPVKQTDKIAAKKEITARKPRKEKSEDDGQFTIQKDSNIPSLLDFLYSKDALNTTSRFLTATAYYITKLRGADYFTLGNIEYAYSVLSIKDRPKYISTAFQHLKTKGGYINLIGKGKWVLTKDGEAFVDYLPKVKKR
jgi:hypothetical protein